MTERTKDRLLNGALATVFTGIVAVSLWAAYGVAVTGRRPKCVDLCMSAKVAETEHKCQWLCWYGPRR
jgi:hypothetical protein